MKLFYAADTQEFRLQAENSLILLIIWKIITYYVC